MTKRLALSIICFGMVACYGSDNVRKKAEAFYSDYKSLTEDAKKERANELISGGILKGNVVNGVRADKIGGLLAALPEEQAKQIILLTLRHGDTVTASQRMLANERLESGVLNLEQMSLVTVRDIADREAFRLLRVINLSYNQLNEIPASFFRMFPKLQKINLSNNPITQLDTTSMQYGLVVIAKNTQLKTILGTNLATLGLVINAYNTPLASNAAELKRLREACTAYRKNPILNCLDRCFCQDPDEQPDISSVINT